MDPARFGGPGQEAAIALERFVAAAEVAAGEQSQQVPDAGKVQALLADQAEHGGDPGIVLLGKVPSPLRRFQGNQQRFTLIKTKQIDGDVEITGYLADLDP